MAVTSINGTRNGTGAVNYVLRPKSNERERVRAIGGLNVRVSRASEQMRITREAHGKNGVNRRTGQEFVQVYRLKQSFSDKELDPNSDEDVLTCNRMGLELAQEVYPDHEVLVVTHSDGLGGKLHNHLIINAVSFETGKSLRAERTNWHYISEKSDEVLKRNGLSVIENKKGQDKKTQAEIELAERGEYVWKDDLKERIRATLENDEITDRDAFIEYMKDEHEVDVRFRGKGISYAFEDDDGKKRRIRSARLGTNFQKENVEEILAENKRIADLEPVPTPTKSRKPRKSSLFDVVMREMKEVRAEKVKPKEKPQQEPQNEPVSLEQDNRKEIEREQRKAREEAENRRKRELAKKQQEERERQARQAQERLEQERKREFLEDVKYVRPILDVVGSDFKVVGYRNQETNKELTAEEVGWYKEYREEQKQQEQADKVATQQNIDELER